jgi:hypothetical protein
MTSKKPPSLKFPLITYPLEYLPSRRIPPIPVLTGFPNATQAIIKASIGNLTSSFILNNGPMATEEWTMSVGTGSHERLQLFLYGDYKIKGVFMDDEYYKIDFWVDLDTLQMDNFVFHNDPRMKDSEFNISEEHSRYVASRFLPFLI